MKKIFAIAATVAMTFGAAATAQTVQTAVLGDSGNSEYPVSVQGANGTLYACKADTFIDTDGVRKRACVTPGGGSLFAAGAGLGAGAAVAGGVLLVAVLAANDGDTATTTTTTNP